MDTCLPKRHAAVLAASALMLSAGLAHGTDAANTPLRPDLLFKPNVIFGMDDSGSMDAELMLYSTDGFQWWDTATGRGWTVDPAHPDPSMRTRLAPAFAPDWAVFLQAPYRWWAYSYLFPNGTGTGNRLNRDHHPNRQALSPPPTTQFAYLRSADYNPIYYDARVTYRPWAPAYLSTGPARFDDANPDRARSHPVYPPTGAYTFNLRREIGLDTRDDFHFVALPGTVIPAGAKKAVCGPQFESCGAWVDVESSEVVSAGLVVKVALPYFPATYWVKEPCALPAAPDPLRDSCTRAPDGATLKRYEIRPEQRFPSGRGYAAELQNFANWFQYYRKRKLMLAGAFGQVLQGAAGMRIGVSRFNARPGNVELYDSDDPSPAANAQRVMGLVYEADGTGTTPAREMLDFIGRQFQRTDRDASGGYAVVQSSCQRNNAFILSDGFADVSDVAVPAWQPGKSERTWGAGAPFERNFASSLADLALRYYTNNPRQDLPGGAVLATARDGNTDLHVNTYGLTIGARGIMFRSEGSAPPTEVNAWPELAPRSPAQVDDLWHATLNGRGRMYIADTAEQTAARVLAGLNDMLDQLGAQSGVSVSTVNLRNGDGRVYRGLYRSRGFAGDVTAHAIDKASGVVQEAPAWSAAQRLLARGWTSRVIASYDGSAGRTFTPAGVGASMNSTDPALFAYLRGSRSGEGSRFRSRDSLLGGVVNAQPVVSAADAVVYAATGEGLLHAFDTDSGEELWAYAPGSALRDMAAGAAPRWQSQTLLDGTPVLAEMNGTSVLIGGRGTAGAGFYALDVTRPRNLDETQLAARVLWEFPSASTPNSVHRTIGLSVGRPWLVHTRRHGWVVLLTSGYNSAAQDGNGRLFMLDARSGRLLRTFVADAGLGRGDPGLAQVSALAESDGTVRRVYGGDEQGNLWRFDLEDGSVSRLARLLDPTGQPQPVTVEPELVRRGADVLVLVGTGRLLGRSDIGAGSTQTFYAIKDGPPLADARAALTPRTLSAAAGKADLAGAAVDWGRSRGWYFDLPAGQQANTRPTVARGAVAFIGNRTELPSCAGASYLYLLDVAAGLGVPGNDGAMMEIAPRTASAVAVLGTSGGAGGVVGGVTLADSRVVTRALNLPLKVAPRKNAWRELVLR